MPPSPSTPRVRTLRLLAPLVGLAFVLAPRDAGAAEAWPAWRGPAGDGVSDNARPPLRWSDTENVVWKAPVPGVGHSSPIVWGDRVYLTSCDVESGERLLLAFDAPSGDLLWRRTVATSGIEPMHRQNTPASSTPATDGRRVVVTFAVESGYLAAAYAPDGEELWRRELPGFASKHGFHSPPVIDGETLLLGGLQDSPEAFVARLDLATGETLWKVETGTPVRSFSPPRVVEAHGERHVVLSGASHTSAYALDDGRLLWRVAGPAEKTVSALVDRDGVVFVCGGRESKLLALRIEPGWGSASLAWEGTQGVPYVPSPLLHGGALHLVSDEGVLTRYDAATGEVLGRRRAPGAVSASPVVAAGRLYVTTEAGVTVVYDLEGGRAPLAANDVGEPCFASLAPVGDRLYLRTTSRLYCLSESAPRTADRRAPAQGR